MKNEDLKNKTVRILWTGGWDSTFRIVELSREDVNIEPVYVCDPNRKSIENEKVAMKEVIKALKMRKETKANFGDIKEINLKDIPQDAKITEAYETVAKETGLGSQHEWLARLGKQIPGMEMGTEAGTPETSHIIDALQKFTKLDIINGIGRVNKELSTEEGNLVLGWFDYPIIEQNEHDMLLLMKKWGYEDIMKHIWFCHAPINGEPCGFCHPCHVKIESHMEFLLPKKSITNYKNQIRVKKIFGERIANLYEKLKRKL